MYLSRRLRSEPRDTVVDLRDPHVMDVLPVGVIFADAQGRATAANRTWEDLSGIDRRAAEGFGWLDAVDPGDRPHVLEQVRAAAEDGAFISTELQLVSGDRPWTWWWIARTRLAEPSVVMAVADADAEHRAKEDLLHQAIHDPLTGLVLRGHFSEELERALASLARHPAHLAVLYIDLDGFKGVNDTYGHAAGDALLIAVARALTRAVRPEDTVARVGGDEFAVICDRLEQPSAAERIAGRVRAALDAPFDVGVGTVRLSAAIGVALADPGDSSDTIIDRADRAMYRAKRGAGSASATT